MSEIFEELKAALAETYELENELGEGGMAFVFLARDLKHDRQVAIKVLKPELSANLGAERFLREIQITAKLTHPHVLPLFDSGIADGYLFYVMPFVEGEPLASYLEREKQLSIDETLKLTREVAEALAYAHSHGLVHRDIKPDNIFLSRGHAIVADFGIARAVTQAGGEHLTQTGMAVGTPAYMSPEQAAGEANVDGRTDIYSLGCVMYEMLVGEIPFTGPNAMAIMARHSMDMITAPHIMRQSIPEEVEDVIYTAMAKTPADRFRTAQDMVDAIQALERGGASGVAGTARLSQAQRMSQAHRASMAQQRLSVGMHVTDAVPAARPWWRRYAAPAAAAVVVAGIGVGVWQLAGSGEARLGTSLDANGVAVLYFRDLSADSSLGFLADGLTEGLIDELGRVQTLRVVSTDGIAPYRGTAVPRDSVARALDVATVVDGTVEALGNRVRVTARLVDGESGADIVDARTTIDLPLARARELGDSLVGQVALTLRNRLGEEVRLRTRRAQTTSDAAWTLVQRAERLRKEGWDRFLQEDLEGGLTRYARADSMLAEAEQRDDRWAEPTVLRARLAFDRARADRRNAGDWVVAALGHADRALAKDARHPRALEIRGETKFRAARAGMADNVREQEQLLADAEQDLAAAVAANPALASAYNALSQLNMFRGDKTTAILNAERAWNADAYLDVVDQVLERLFWANYDLERLTDAQRWCDRGRQRFPAEARFAECQLMLMASEGGAADPAGAWRLAQEMVANASPLDTAFNRSLGRLLVGGVLARAGQADSARAVLQGARVGPGVDRGGTLAFTEAYARILLGDKRGAIERLKRYLLDNPEQHHGLRGEGDLYWWWRPLLGDPEFERLNQGA